MIDWLVKLPTLISLMLPQCPPPELLSLFSDTLLFFLLDPVYKRKQLISAIPITKAAKFQS